MLQLRFFLKNAKNPVFSADFPPDKIKLYVPVYISFKTFRIMYPKMILDLLSFFFKKKKLKLLMLFQYTPYQYGIQEKNRKV